MKFPKLNRKVHSWGAIISSIPILIVIVTGIILLLKKDVDWIQPSTERGSGGAPTLAFNAVLAAAKTVPEAEISSWDDIDRLDVRPGKAVIKIRSNNRWEIQIDHQTGEILKTAYRRSDLIESLHDGSWFHDLAKLWVWLPCAVILLVLWLTGIYLFFQPILARRKRKRSTASR